MTLLYDYLHPERYTINNRTIITIQKGTFLYVGTTQCTHCTSDLLRCILYPVGSWVNNTGKVYVRYLDPILPSEAKDRDGMMRLARRRMLEAFLDTPGPIGLDLDWSIRLFSIFAIVSVVVADYFWWILVRDVFLRRLGYSVGSLTIGSILVVVAITLFLYVYNVYLINLGGGDGNRNGSSTNGALKIKTKGANNSETEKTLDEKSSLVDKK